MDKMKLAQEILEDVEAKSDASIKSQDVNKLAFKYGYVSMMLATELEVALTVLNRIVSKEGFNTSKENKESALYIINKFKK